MIRGDWLDGPRFVAWLGTLRKLPKWPPSRFWENPDVRLTESDKRRLSEWRRGAVASFYTVDPMLVRLGLHWTDMPDELETQHRKAVAVPKEERKRIREAFLRDPTQTAGFRPSTIRRWSYE